MKTTRELIAEELRSLRAREKISLEAIADKSNVNKDTIWRYENNQVSMQIDTLEKILVAYGQDFNIFFTKIYANKHSMIKEE